MTEVVHREGSARFRTHYDASQYRRDLWSELKHATARYERLGTEDVKSAAVAEDITERLVLLERIERYWAFPGTLVCRELKRNMKRGAIHGLARRTANVARLLVSDAYRSQKHMDQRRSVEANLDEDAEHVSEIPKPQPDGRPYFEVLLVDDLPPDEVSEARARLLAMQRDEDQFIYDVVIVPSAEDALIAVQFNHNIETCVLRYSFPQASRTSIPELRDYLATVDLEALETADEELRSCVLGRLLKNLRPELDLFLNTDDPVEEIAGITDADFRRVFYTQEDYLELHLSILKGISERFETPFFTALKKYSQKSTGVFHALPISRGKSITRSNWIQDMGRFYGQNIFLAETSATSGGLDSLLQPHGPLKRAQELAARAFGARRSFFVTNGTSSANKIVMQAMMQPGDIVMVSHDCHKSHHYAIMLAGAQPVYMDPYPLNDYTMYGAVSLRTIVSHLLDLKRVGKLHRVRMVLLTNCTFDGIIYNPERVMQTVLAIKPDMIFVWDEAWFAFARCTPTYRRRTAMEAAAVLRNRYRSEDYKADYETRASAGGEPDVDDIDGWLAEVPDPAKVRIRVYATQSTHKTLTSLRQGSMIHVYDQDFERKAREAFTEAYMTYTSTSPNYQILASMDVGRRQVELEGYELVRKSVEVAMLLRKQIEEHPKLRRFFNTLTMQELIPAEFRPSGLAEFYNSERGFQAMEEAFRDDEFALDPTRVTLHVGNSGYDGDSFKQMLMDDHDIQLNKTSRNTVLFMLNIGTSRGAVAYLVKVLVNLAKKLNDRVEERHSIEERRQAARVTSLTADLPPLPNFSRFHAAFAADPDQATPEGDLRAAYFLAYDPDKVEFLSMDKQLDDAMRSGREVVSASFVTPYPPGFPILVPGQVISPDILAYMRALDVKEIHGYNPAYGFRVFTEATLAQQAEDRPAPDSR